MCPRTHLSPDLTPRHSPDLQAELLGPERLRALSPDAFPLLPFLSQTSARTDASVTWCFCHWRGPWALSTESTSSGSSFSTSVTSTCAPAAPHCTGSQHPTSRRSLAASLSCHSVRSDWRERLGSAPQVCRQASARLPSLQAHGHRQGMGYVDGTGSSRGHQSSISSPKPSEGLRRVLVLTWPNSGRPRLSQHR